MKNLILLFFLSFFFCTSYAQNDSIRIAEGKPKLVFSFDGRYSFVKYDAVNIAGLKLGVDFNNKWRVGIGFYGLLKPADYNSTARIPIGANGTIVPFHSNTKLWYGAIYGEYVIIHRKRWELSIPIQFGIGKTKIDASPNDSLGIKYREYINQGDLNKTVFIVEPSITGYYKVFNWIGVGTGVGYRQLIGADHRLNSIFNNPIFIIKAKLFLGDFIDVIAGRKPAFKYVNRE